MAGPGNTSVRSYDLYRTGTVTADFTDTEIIYIDDNDGTQFLSTGMIIVNDGAGEMQFSFDGSRVDGLVLPNEVLTFDFRKKRRIFLRGVSGSTPDFRFWAW